MGATVYGYLSQLGYHHPLHPVLVHLPLGLVMGGFLFILIGRLSRRETLAKTARHCMRLAALSLPVAAAGGYLDWVHFYGASWLLPIKAKMGLAVVLLLLVIAAPGGRKKGAEGEEGGRLGIYLLALICAGAMGYFGGEMVYGGRGPSASAARASAPADTETADAVAPDAKALTLGGEVFADRCAFCHYSDSTDGKVGPGLKGILQRETLPTSGWPATEENLRRQLKTPFEAMPAFEDLTPEQVDAVVVYLKSL